MTKVRSQVDSPNISITDLYVDVPLVDELLDVEREAGPGARRQAAGHARLAHHAVLPGLGPRQPERERACIHNVAYYFPLCRYTIHRLSTLCLGHFAAASRITII